MLSTQHSNGNKFPWLDKKYFMLMLKKIYIKNSSWLYKNFGLVDKKIFYVEIEKKDIKNPSWFYKDFGPFRQKNISH